MIENTTGILDSPTTKCYQITRRSEWWWKQLGSERISTNVIQLKALHLTYLSTTKYQRCFS